MRDTYISCRKGRSKFRDGAAQLSAEIINESLFAGERACIAEDGCLYFPAEAFKEQQGLTEEYACMAIATSFGVAAGEPMKCIRRKKGIRGNKNPRNRRKRACKR